MPGTVRPVVDELDGLLTYLDQQRLVLRIAAYGLTDEQARTASTVSALTVGGLVKHCAFVEQFWVSQVPGADAFADVDVAPGQNSYVDGFTLHPRETLAGMLSTWDDVATRTTQVVRAATLDTPVPVPRDAPWYPADLEAWSVRWLMLHLIQETARHAGHADIVREAVDGATAFPLMAAVEQWNVPWMTAWEPATSS